MDTSEIYINMCDCEEIQSQWKPKWGDWYYYDDYEDAEDNIVVLEKTHQMIDWVKEERQFYAKYKHPRWLPRQDQLVEMIGGYQDQLSSLATLATLVDVSGKIDVAKHPLLEPAEWRRFESLEQLWLAYVMFRNFGKTWDGERWRANEPS